ncbi:hypothetical protein TWF481_006547 [Arthrobotrys musiformis]|uniref:BTB domain-containing protein n=1 Tax=Arthrobotrys musiformis TaxID=47236 RepID=A0AAV9W8V0_9PEZI
MSESKRDPFERLNPFRKFKKRNEDNDPSTGRSPLRTVVSVSTMPLSNDPDPTPQPSATGITTTPAKQQQDPTIIGQPGSPLGHQPPNPDYTPWTRRKDGEESPLFRKSLIGLRPYSPQPTGGVPDDMKIPHGLENPATKKEKGPDGLKEEVSKGNVEDQKDGVAGSDDHSDDDDAMTDDHDEDWEDARHRRKKVKLSAEVLASPQIRLILDHTDVSDHDEKVTFYVHLGLLEKSSFLLACISPHTTELILDHRLKPYAVDAVIKYLYTGDIDISHQFGTVEDSETDFDKLTTVEWTSCYLGVPPCRQLAFHKIETLYRAFEFGYNHSAAQNRVKMTKWIYGLDEEYVEPDGWVHRMRRRVLAGWCRDLSTIQNDQKLLESFEDILSEFPTFSFDLEEFLTERAREEPKMKHRLDAFKQAEKSGTERFARRRALMFPGTLAHPSKLQLPVLQPKKGTHQLPIIPSDRLSSVTPGTAGFSLSANAPSFTPVTPKPLAGDGLGGKTPVHKASADSITPGKPDTEPKSEEPPLRKRASRISRFDKVAKFLGSKSIRQ